MIATFFIITGITLGTVFLLSIIILFLPVSLKAEFAFSETVRSGRALLCWIHPRIAQCMYDIAGRSGELNVLGWRKVLREKEEAAPESSGASEPLTGKKKKTEASASGRRAQPSETRTGTGSQATAPAGEGRRMGASEQRTEAAGRDVHREEKEPPRARIQEADVSARPLSWWGKARKTWTIIRDLRISGKLFRWCVRVLRLCFRLVRFDHFRLHAAAGVEDPAELGRMYGWYASLKTVLFGKGKNVDIRFEPLFFREQLEFEGSFGFQTSAARLLFPVAVGLLTFPYLKMYLAWRRLKKVYR